MSQDLTIIVGAGLSGLACAIRLWRTAEVLLLEASDSVGGRLKTDLVDGFRLDHGFQVLQTAYPEAKRLLDYGRLDLRPFAPGAIIRTNQRFVRMSDLGVDLKICSPRSAMESEVGWIDGDWPSYGDKSNKVRSTTCGKLPTSQPLSFWSKIATLPRTLSSDLSNPGIAESFWNASWKHPTSSFALSFECCRKGTLPYLRWECNRSRYNSPNEFE